MNSPFPGACRIEGTKVQQTGRAYLEQNIIRAVVSGQEAGSVSKRIYMPQNSRETERILFDKQVIMTKERLDTSIWYGQ